MSADALASFEAKWTLARPELPLALRFEPEDRRPVVGALACLACELEYAAFQLAEAEVAASKLQWWAAELASVPDGAARHPLTTILAGHDGIRGIPVETWAALIAAAMAQRDSASASTLADQLAAYRRFYLPLATIESVLNADLDAVAIAEANALRRALEDSIHWRESLAGDRLPLPLDLLARHRLSRADLGVSGVRHDAALAEHLASLAEAMRAHDRRGLSVLAALALHVAERRSRRAANAAEPLDALVQSLDRLPLSSAWVGWRAARRLRRAG